MALSDGERRDRAVRWVILNCKGEDFEFAPSRSGNIYMYGKYFHAVITQYGDIALSVGHEIIDDFFEKQEINATLAEPTVTVSPEADT